MHLWPRSGESRKKAITDDRKQPRLCVLSPKSVEAPIGAQYRLLNDVLGVRGRTREPTREIVGRVEVRQDLRLESVALGIHASRRALFSSVLVPSPYVTTGQA